MSKSKRIYSEYFLMGDPLDITQLSSRALASGLPKNRDNGPKEPAEPTDSYHGRAPAASPPRPPSAMLLQSEPVAESLPEVVEPSFLPSGELGEGFPAHPRARRGWGEKLHGFLAHSVGGVYDFALRQVMNRISNTTSRGIGVDVAGLLGVERTMYQVLAGGGDAVNGQLTPPVFQALAEGQAAYVNLGPKRDDEAEHFMRMFAGLPLELIETMEHPDPKIDKVRRHLLGRAQAKEFPIFVDIDDNFDEVTPTESIATESIASIARRENSFGSAFPDPRMYYRWLMTRVESNYRRLDPWLFGTKPKVHDDIVAIKQELVPPWLQGNNQSDPFGATPNPKKTQKAYETFMSLAGNGVPPTWDTLCDIADTVVGLDRDLLSGIQTFWIKLNSEASPEQRKTLMAPVSRAWVQLNALGKDHPEFGRVSPENSPYIELLEKRSGNIILERYDRALATSQAVDHLLNGLGLSERQTFLNILMDDIRAVSGQLEERESRLRERYGPAYRGLDIQGLLQGKLDIHKPEVKGALDDLRAIASSNSELLPGGTKKNEMTPEYAEIVRHRDLMDWVATRYSRYGDQAFDCLMKNSEFQKNPLILGAYYEPEVNPPGGTTPLPPGPHRQEVWGQPVPGQEPLPMSLVFEGGGGKGFAYVETVKQLQKHLEAGQGQVKVDEFVGNSAGALTAGLLAGGYSPEELGDVMRQLDFKKFYSDYLWLSGGVDPKVRGLNRTGLFSQQKMYKTLSELLKAKCPVQGRPVLFRDLPFHLKVTATVLNADIPDDVMKALKVGPEGQIVFSSENTPNMDVAAALCASAAIPGFFDAPQVQLSQSRPRGSEHPKVHRMQLVDGGVVNNFPVARAGQEGDEAFLVTLPTFAEAPNPNGGPPIQLSTLNFDYANIDTIDAFNRQQYERFGSQVAETLQKAREGGRNRAVVAMNLTGLSEQTEPILQGRTRKETRKLLEVASQTGLPHLSASQGAEVIKKNLESKERSLVEQQLLNFLLDKNDSLDANVFFQPRYRILKEEASGIADMLGSVVGANLVAPTHLDRHLFEKK